MPDERAETGPGDLAAIRAAIKRWYHTAVAAVAPRPAVANTLRLTDETLFIDDVAQAVHGRLAVVAVGKAAVAMATGAHDALGERITDGFVLTKEGHDAGGVPPGFAFAAASHPIPDDRGVAATEHILKLVSSLTADVVLLALISGGGSALLEAPRPPLTLADFAQTTDALLRAGAPIEALNAVRRPLSQVKAGGLLRAAAPAAVHTLILSDVLGNDPQVIASGPTVPGAADASLALATLDRFGVRDRVPAAVVALLVASAAAAETSPPPANGSVVFIGDNAQALAALKAAVIDDGRRAAIVARDLVGEAGELGAEWVARSGAAPPELDVLLGGGEATVTVRGAGTGGRNTEFALAAAIALAAEPGAEWVIASLATDGDDGPTGAAGAIADSETVKRAAHAGVDAMTALRANDSRAVFAAAGGLVVTGPTGTNVNDLYLAVRRDRPAATGAGLSEE